MPITDRAKRYRAASRNEQPKRICLYCGAPNARNNEHIDGDEANDAPENLGYACQPCNATKGAFFSRAGLGKRTRQFNPASALKSRKQWDEAVNAVMGRASTMTPYEAVRRLQATRPERRADWAAASRANPRKGRKGPKLPSYELWATAIATTSGQDRMPMDEARKIVRTIREAGLTSAYQRETWKRRKAHAGEVPF